MAYNVNRGSRNAYFIHIKEEELLMSKEKISFEKLRSSTSSWNTAIIVFTQGSFEKNYTELERSYKIKSDAKYFNIQMIGNSLFGDCLDGSEHDIRLDKHIDNDGWVIDYCYIID